MNQDELLIIEKLLDIPPQQSVIILTSDQQNHWLETKKVFMVFHQFFTDYFSGNPINLQILSKESRDFFSAKFDEFLSFYNLLQWGWHYLKEAETKLDVSFYDSPGQCFAKYLESIANAQNHQCFIARIDFSPKKRAELLRAIKRVLSEEGRKNDIPMLKVFLRQSKNHGFFEFSLLEDFALEALGQIKNRQIQDKIKQYRQASLNSAEAEARYSRQNSINAYAWEDGYILQSQKAGGTYMKSN